MDLSLVFPLPPAVEEEDDAVLEDLGEGADVDRPSALLVPDPPERGGSGLLVGLAVWPGPASPPDPPLTLSLTLALSPIVNEKKKDFPNRFEKELEKE